MKPGEHIVLLTNYSIITSEQMFCRCEQNVNQSTQGQKSLLTEKIHTVPNRREGRNCFFLQFLLKKRRCLVEITMFGLRSSKDLKK